MSEEQAEYKTKETPTGTCKICGSKDYVVKKEQICIQCKMKPQTNRNGYVVVGIDPDTEKSGYAEYDINQKKLVDVRSYSFFDIYEILESSREVIQIVRIEAGWLNEKANWHGRHGQTKVAGERIAKNVGANHETGRKLVEMCRYLDIPHEIVKPLGTKAIDAGMFKKITGWTERTNQDNRDAAMLCYGYK